ncbi:hypothetical protein F9U64_07920 [Gracilibacillus oryzae]|uniref:Uncharacterized protein n=1 Tax=Gracilibacillus oryzae TaxID=1672701 RepID=A0A7C8KT34_9BACI|nr:hypothetical protein [Gracilibacillus oryzae]KAB8137723.1 hypothetical protein F9U64_07920 [Gracilibacillus oryzae]
MLNAILFWSISSIFFYKEGKRLWKLKAKKDMIIFTIFMCFAVTIITLHLFGVQFPYLIHVLDFITKPISEPLRQWLNSFHHT